MILIVDGGSTKTDWCFAVSPSSVITVHTDGLNPVIQQADDISDTLICQLLPEMQAQGVMPSAVTAVHYYGAGCTPERKHVMETLLSGCFAEATRVTVDSDLLAAARALCGRQAGVACILGTGSNSCLYDGDRIVANTPALGYILGDEGSGSVLGRRFLNALLKGCLPTELREEFFETCHTSLNDIIERVYRRPMPNRFLASTSRFIADRLYIGELEQMVIANFECFILNNLHAYSVSDKVFHAIGGMATAYEAQLRKAAERQGWRVGVVERTPVSGLIAYHCCEP